jgi:hypothetical protein
VPPTAGRRAVRPLDRYLDRRSGPRRWSGAGGDLLGNAQGSGFTLAHEWGHYALGLYDEYASGSSTRDYLPRSTDTRSNPSIMNNQWCAASGYSCPSGFTNPDADFLEFSTEDVAPFDAPLSASNTNAQYRVYGKSGWDTLVDSTDNDPKVASFPDRTRYTNLDGVKPPDNGDFTVNDDESNCRDELDIRWMQEELVLDILLDRSGSMDGTPIANAKTAANLLIDSLPEGNAACGVSSFATGTSNDFDISEIPDPDTGVKDAGKTAVNNLFASGVTSLSTSKSRFARACLYSLRVKMCASATVASAGPAISAAVSASCSSLPSSFSPTASSIVSNPIPEYYSSLIVNIMFLLGSEFYFIQRGDRRTGHRRGTRDRVSYPERTR